MSLAVIEARNISKRYGGVQALENVSIEVFSGEVLCLAGENGSGKSTLSKCIAGTVIADEGEIFLEGQNVNDLSPEARMDAGIQIIYQDFSLFENLSATENIYLVKQSISGKSVINKKKGNQDAKSALESIGVKMDIRRKVGSLSVGQKQSVAIARAIIQDAKLIIMDEPTTALTDVEIGELLQIVRHLAEKGIAFIFISHKLEEILQLTDRTVVLRNGKEVLSADTRTLNEDAITRSMLGRDLPKPTLRSKITHSDILLKLNALQKSNHFGPIDLTIRTGQVLGLGGRLGAGRTALARTIFGLMQADAGSMTLNGIEYAPKSVNDAIAHHVAYVPEDRLSEGLFLTRSVESNATVTILDRLVHRFASLKDSELRLIAEDWVKRLLIATPSVDVRVSALSGGNQQRVVLAKWLMSEPKLLILNRPSVGVDVGSKFEIHQIVRDVADKGVGVIVITDDLPELDAMCDEKLWIENGVIADFPHEEKIA